MLSQYCMSLASSHEYNLLHLEQAAYLSNVSKLGRKCFLAVSYDVGSESARFCRVKHESHVAFPLLAHCAKNILMNFNNAVITELEQPNLVCSLKRKFINVSL